MVFMEHVMNSKEAFEVPKNNLDIIYLAMTYNS